MPLEIKHQHHLKAPTLSIEHASGKGHGCTFMYQNTYLNSTYLLYSEADKFKLLQGAVCEKKTQLTFNSILKPCQLGSARTTKSVILIAQHTEGPQEKIMSENF